MSQRIAYIMLFLTAGLLCVNQYAQEGASNSSKELHEDDSTQELVILLEEFAAAWNNHDLDGLMSMMTEHCVFEASGGTNVNGERYKGQEAVRASFASVFQKFPDAHWGGARHFVTGNRGVSQWTFSGTMNDGRRIEVDGCDIFTFSEGKIAIKNSFRKNRVPIKDY